VDAADGSAKIRGADDQRSRVKCGGSEQARNAERAACDAA
jgi:hypothetical protein